MVNNVYYAVLALPSLGVLLYYRGAGVKASSDLLLWALLLAWFAVVGIWSGDAQHYKHLLYVALFVLTVSRLIDPQPFRHPLFARALYWILVGYVSGSALFYWETGHYALGERVLWLPSRMTGPIYTSMWIACCFALALPGWLRSRQFAELAFALLVALFCMGYVLQSRSGLVALAALVLLASIYLSFRRLRDSLWLAGSLVIVGSFALWAGLTYPEVGSLFERADAGRLQLWSIMLHEWYACGLWMGCGLEHRTDQLLLNGEAINHPHSIFLSLGVFGGAVALVIFVALMTVVLRRAWLSRDPWGLYLATALIGLNFDGTKLIGNPDELWLLVILPACLISHPRLSASHSG
ncbi:O-antigen ligase family protein [Pseudomonas azotifigens]|uniref:O-antigen ligase family protein n=2 Tax=Stutzerimonas azotifigens TaxID=291995 RepID=A0ABR5Z067_9GAMM|nr:O-antigen ligase family protein [Stutzerimonas azotifigens]